MTIYLTFDDGPQLPGTRNCISILNEFNLPATFFVIGSHLFEKRNKEVVGELIVHADRFLLANHSFTHAQEVTYSDYYNMTDYATNDIVECQSKACFLTKIVRLPGNSAWVNSKELVSRKQVNATCISLKNLEYIVVGWDLEWRTLHNHGNISDISYSELLQEIYFTFSRKKTKTCDHLVLLLHDRMFSTELMKIELYNFLCELKKDINLAFSTIDKHPFVCV